MYIQTFYDRACTLKALTIDAPFLGSFELASGDVLNRSAGDISGKVIKGAVKIRNFGTAASKLFAQYTDNLNETVYIKTGDGDSVVRLILKLGLTSIVDPDYPGAQYLYRYQITLELYNGQDWVSESSGGTNITADAEHNYFAASFVIGGETYATIYYQSSTDPDGVNVHGFFATQNFFDGSKKEASDSKVPTATPSGYFGDYSRDSVDYQPGTAYLGIGGINTDPEGHGLRVYDVTDAQVNDLYNRLWSKNIWDMWENKRFNPIGGLLSLHRLPVPVPAIGQANFLMIAGQKYDLKSQAWIVKDNAVPWESVEKAFPISDYSMSFLDYAPYISAMLYLPFIGWVSVDPNKFIGGSLQVRYIVDVITGNCLAHVIAKDRDQHKMLHGTYAGNCAFTFPITGNDNGGLAALGAFAGFATAGLTALISGGSAAPVAAAAIAGGTSVLGAEHHMQQAGSLPHNVSALAEHLTIEVLLTQPNILTPDTYSHVLGYPAGDAGTVGDYSGLLSGTVHADGIDGATDAEKRTIEAALAGGVFV